MDSETVSIGTTWRKPLRGWTALWSYKHIWKARGLFSQATVYVESVRSSVPTRSIRPFDEQKEVGVRACAQVSVRSDTILRMRHVA